MQLHEKYGDRVVGISLNVDFVGGTDGLSQQLQRDVVSVLTKLSIACENVISSDPMDDVLGDFDVFSLPAVLVFNSQGELHKCFDGSFSYQEHVFPELEQLLEPS